MSNYSEPVSKLLTFGTGGDGEEPSKEWPDYIHKFGLTADHIPDLIRMATDNDLRWDNLTQEDPEVWAQLHAARALGQLHAESAIEPLLKMFHDDDDDDWMTDELPRVYGMIGAKALPALIRYLGDDSHGVHPRWAAATALVQIAKNHPESRDECVRAITEQLKYYQKNDHTLNGGLIFALVQLHATEARFVIKAAFDARRVETFIVGDWYDVQVDLGLTGRDPKRETSSLKAILNEFQDEEDESE